MNSYQAMMNGQTLKSLKRRVEQLEKALSDYRQALAKFNARPTGLNRTAVAHWAHSVRVWRDLVNRTRAELVNA